MRIAAAQRGGDLMCGVDTNEMDVLNHMPRPIQSALEEVEQTFLSCRELWPRPGWVEEYTAAMVRLRELYEYLEIEMERQDLAFRTEQGLHTLREHCLWLVRRIGREVFFRTQLAMERELRSQTGNTAYNMYLRLVEIQDLEQQFLSLSDTQLAMRLLDGALEEYRDLGSPVVPE